MLIYQPSVLISSALRLPDLALSLSSFFILSHLSAQLFPLHVSLINTFQLLTLLSFAILFVSFGPSALSFSSSSFLSLFVTAPLFFLSWHPNWPHLWNVYTDLDLRLQTPPLTLFLPLFLLHTDSLWQYLGWGKARWCFLIKGVCLLPFPRQILLLPLFASFSYFFLLPLSP